MSHWASPEALKELPVEDHSVVGMDLYEMVWAELQKAVALLERHSPRTVIPCPDCGYSVAHLKDCLYTDTRTFLFQHRIKGTYARSHDEKEWNDSCTTQDAESV